MNISRILVPAIVLAASAGGAFAAKLDLTAEADFKAVSYVNLKNLAPSAGNGPYFFENAALGFTVKNIKLPAYEESTMDIGVGFRAVGIAGSTTAYRQPFAMAASRYPDSSFTPFMERAYVKVNKLLDYDITFTAGRQPFSLASGLALSDDGAGLTGLRMKFNSIWRELAGQLFAFQPKAEDSASGGVSIAGASIELPSEGLWQIYDFWEFDRKTGKVLESPESRATRHFAGVNYTLRQGRLAFEGEAAIERGSAKTDGGEVSFKGAAFIISGKWNQPMGAMGNGTGRVAFGRGSGDKSSTRDVDETFFPSYGHRTNGLERSGFGEIYGASLYDALGSSTSTANGLPEGMSGIQMVNIGATLPVYKGIYTDIDLFFYEAAASTAKEGKKLGTEWDIKLTCPIAEKLKLSAVYAMFSPGKAYPSHAPVHKFAIQTSARF